VGFIVSSVEKRAEQQNPIFASKSQQSINEPSNDFLQLLGYGPFSLAQKRRSRFSALPIVRCSGRVLAL
jgi:hypothetical protein